MTGRMIFESIRQNLLWADGSPIIDGAFILSGALFHCISPWSLYDQWCPKSNIDEVKYKKTLSEKMSDSFKKYKNVFVNEDFYKNTDELKSILNYIFFSKI